MTDELPSLAEELQAHLKHAAAARHLVRQAVRGIHGEVSDRAVVCATLLARIANDLEAIEHLTALGFHLQASALAASTFEVTFALPGIVATDEAAREWILHEDPTQPVTRNRANVEAVLRQIGREDRIAAELRCYARLCMAKHANPLLQILQSAQINGDAVEIKLGGQFDEVSMGIGVFSLIHATRLAKIAVSHSREHIAGAIFDSIRVAFLELEETRQQLYLRAVARGWNIDHFTGLWGRLEEGP